MKRSVLILSVATTAAGVFLTQVPSFTVNAQTAASKALPKATVSPTPPSFVASPTPTPPVVKDDDEIIKIDTELVNVNVRVVDRNNRPIANLRQSDFKILEDGVPQKIDFFSQSEVPTNYALVVDNSGSLRSQLDKVIEAGKVLVNTNRKDDESMIIRFVGKEKIEILQSFTPSKDDLEYALDQMFIEGGQTALIDAVYLAVQNVDEYEKSQKFEDRRRRAIVLVTDGEDRNSYYKENQLFDLLKEADVQIYVVGFVGDLPKDGGFIGKSAQSKAKAFLDRLASVSGGKALSAMSTEPLRSSSARTIASGTILKTTVEICGFLP